MGRPNQDFPGKPSFLDGIIFEETADEVWICKEQIDTAKLPKLILHAKTKTCGTEEEQKRRDRDVILLEGIQRNTSKGGYNVVQFKLKDCGRLYPVDDAPSLQSCRRITARRCVVSRTRTWTSSIVTQHCSTTFSNARKLRSRCSASMS